MPSSRYLPFDIHGSALALFLKGYFDFGPANIADIVISGIILFLLGVNFWKRNDKKQSNIYLSGSIGLFCLKVSVFQYDCYTSMTDALIALMLLFSLCIPFWKTHDKYQHRALLVCFFGMFVAIPAYLVGVGYLLLYKFPSVGNGAVFLGIMLGGAIALIIGLALLVVRIS